MRAPQTPVRAPSSQLCEQGANELRTLSKKGYGYSLLPQGEEKKSLGIFRVKILPIKKRKTLDSKNWKFYGIRYAVLGLSKGSASVLGGEAWVV